ncbi:MAG TPA: hypothetical protein VMT31_04715 [Methanomicrobiales archaeon]|nr:hypothetical protein [Methanomicrobiales archaeon]
MSAKETEFPYRLSMEDYGIRIMAELPGVDEKMIQIDLEDRNLSISAADRERLYRVAIALPGEVRLKEKRFRKGVLDLFLERTDGH